MTQHRGTRRRLSARPRLLVVAAAGVAVAGLGAVAVAGPASSSVRCSSALAHQELAAGSAAQRACVIAVAGTYLDAVQHTIRPDRVLLDPAVADHALGTDPVHAAGNDKASRAAIAKDTTRRLTGRDWTVDGDEAVVVVTGHRGGQAVAYTEMLRFTLRHGRIWEVLHDRQEGVPAAGGGFPNTPVVAVAGPPAPAERVGNPDDPTWCSDTLAARGDRSMTAANHRRCMIAIATTYINGEENSAPGNQILFDPRVSRFGLGGKASHHPSNSDLLRTQEGTFQGTYNRVIRSIINRHWTVDGNKAWIVYDGMLVTSVTHPQFHVAERFEIRSGLIWEIMIAPVVTTLP